MPPHAPIRPRLSIVTPCLNSEKTIRDTLESVWAQTVPPHEHLIVDGGSTDNTLSILKEYPQLKVESGFDEGHYDAMNKGIRRAEGEVVAVLNADDSYRLGALEAVARAFAEHPDWDGLFGDVVYVDGAGKEIYRRQEAVFDYATLKYCFGYICHPCLFVRKRVYDAYGDYRHREFKNLCDYDFVLRIARAGCRIGALPEYIVNFRYHDFGQSLDKRVIRNFDREMWQLKREHGVPGGLLGRLLYVYGHARRQWQKLRYRRTCDLVPARWILRRHMRERTVFSSNIGLDKLEDG